MYNIVSECLCWQKRIYTSLWVLDRESSQMRPSPQSHIYRTPYFFIISSGTSPINDPFYLIVYICGLGDVVIWSVDGRGVHCSGPPTISDVVVLSRQHHRWQRRNCVRKAFACQAHTRYVSAQTMHVLLRSTEARTELNGCQLTAVTLTLRKKKPPELGVVIKNRRLYFKWGKDNGQPPTQQIEIKTLRNCRCVEKRSKWKLHTKFLHDTTTNKQ